MELNGSAHTHVWVEFAEGLCPSPAVEDGLLFAILHRLMEEGEPVRVEGPISAHAVRGVQDLQEVWHNLLPRQYRPIPIEYSDIRPDQQARPEKFLAAFSGGLDSLFTAVRHTDGKRGAGSYPVGAFLLIHGFDVPLDMPESFASLERDCRRFADSTGLPLYTLRTNLREAIATDWEMCHGAMLAGCLHQFAASFRGALVASGAPYSNLPMPWGSSPALDYLSGNANFAIVHDGAGFLRLDKVAYLKDHQAALECMKVCCNGPAPEVNCGTCSKCMRTRLALALWGIYEPPTFPGRFTAQTVRDYHPPKAREIYHARTVLDKAREMGLKEEWVDVLERKLNHMEREEAIRGPLRKLVGGGKNPLWRRLQIMRHRLRQKS
ncbi:MAG: hypothetical protein NW208_13320 [Bryobacter sp.]|nr:hypothetical protein [Bryobacter sp.]